MKMLSDKFLDALRESIIIQAIITVGVLSVWLYKIAADLPIQDSLTQVVFIVLGFYFGSKVGFGQGAKAKEDSILKRVSDYRKEE